MTPIQYLCKSKMPWLASTLHQSALLHHLVVHHVFGRRAKLLVSLDDLHAPKAPPQASPLQKLLSWHINILSSKLADTFHLGPISDIEKTVVCDYTVSEAHLPC